MFFLFGFLYGNKKWTFNKYFFKKKISLVIKNSQVTQNNNNNNILFIFLFILTMARTVFSFKTRLIYSHERMN